MAGNTFGRLFKITTFGESHGPAVGVVIDGVPPGLPLSAADIQPELDRRRPGQSRLTTQRDEKDSVEILSGLFQGKTTGALLVHNQNQKSADYEDLKAIFRPGHADYTYLAKYGIRDYRGGGRSSGRETVARVAAGAVAKKILSGHGIAIYAYTASVGKIKAASVDLTVIDKNPVRAADLKAAALMAEEIEQARQKGDSIGGTIAAIVQGCPPGLGDPVFDKLEAVIGHALLSLGAVKGIEFGTGFSAAVLKGSENNDLYEIKAGKISTKTNNCGGILGGISTGADVILRLAVKPTASIAVKQQTVNLQKEPATVEVKGRHDPCLCPRLVPVVEAMLALCILDALMIQKTITEK